MSRAYEPGTDHKLAPSKAQPPKRPRPPIVHLGVPYVWTTGKMYRACKVLWFTGEMTTKTHEVTCESCKRTRYYRGLVRGAGK